MRRVGRYEVLDELAQGGMATVHIGKMSAEGGFSRVVAIKQMHATFARDADFRAMFLDEARLVSRVRHAHVADTLDVIEQDGELFLVMEYVHGPSLGRMLRDLRAAGEKMPVGVAVSILVDVLEGLHAAHEARSETGAPLRIVHRDVSPPNVLVGIDGIGRVLDFGVAHAADKSGRTMPGQVKGKPSYMAPEQAEGKELDRRADVYAAAAVLWELLTGERVFQAESAAGIMLRHVQEKPAAPSERRPEVSPALDAVVLRGLEKRPDDRFATAREMAEALAGAGPRASRAEVGGWLERTEAAFFAERDGLLARVEPPTPVQLTASETSAATSVGARSPWARRGALGAAVAMAALAAVGGVFASRGSRASPAQSAAASPAPSLPVPKGTPQQPVTILVPDFATEGGDPALGGTLGRVFREIINDSPETVTGFGKRASLVARTLQLDGGAGGFDDETWRLAAATVGAPALVVGRLTADGAGAGYRLRVRVVEPLGGSSWLDRSASGPSPDATLGLAADMALAVRDALGDTSTPEQRSRAGDAFRFTNVAAASAYVRACVATQDGSWDAAVREASASVAADPSFAMGQFALALAYGNAGRNEDAELAYLAVLARIDRLSESNRLMASGLYFTVRHEPAKAVEQLSQYVERYPANFGGAMDLANAYFAMRDMRAAVKEGARAYGLGSATLALANLALYEAYAGDFDASVRDARAVLLLGGDSSETAIVALAHAELGLGHVDQAHEAYARLAERGATPASRASLGEADIALAEGRLDDAERILGEGIAADEGAGANDLAHVKQAALAETHLRMGRRADAIAEAQRVAAASHDLAVLVPVARLYATAGARREGAALASQLRARVDPDAQSYAALLDGESLLAAGRARDALGRFEAAQKLADTWLVRLDLGRAYLALGLYPEAYQELDACSKRRGEALAVYLDEVPTYRVWSELAAEQRRAEQGLTSAVRGAKP